MSYWWVNQNQTYKYEVPGGYLWSPKRKTNGRRDRAYDLMRTIKPGDIIFSYADTYIKAIGVARSYHYEFPKPIEFINTENNWSDVGWRVDVDFKKLDKPLKVKDYIETLRPFIPDKYSPLQKNGNGNQTFYLYDLSKDFALAIAHLVERWVVDYINGNYVFDLSHIDNASNNISEWEGKIEESIVNDKNIGETQKISLIKARVGQGKYRESVFAIEKFCRITKVDRIEHLVASHIKPWRDSSNEERLDPHNGLMLTPTIDHLFDRGFIGFDNNGSLIISPSAHHESLIKMGVPVKCNFNAGLFTDAQKKYLDWHRDTYF